MLHGRGDECATVEEALRSARCGRGRSLLLRGSAGIGKSALLQHARGRADGTTVLTERGVQAESGMAYAGLESLVRPLVDQVEVLPTTQAVALRVALGVEAGPPPGPFLVSSAVVGLLSQAAESRPVTCLVDDVQWLDAESLNVLAFVSRRIASDPIAMVLAVRDDEPQAAEAITLLSSVETMPLRPLEDDDAERLLRDRVSPTLDSGLVARVLTTAQGNPLALVELATENALRSADDDTELSLSARLERTYRSRVDALPQGVRDFLLLAALHDSPELDPLMAAATELRLTDTALAAAQRHLLVRVVGDSIEFSHPLVRSAIRSRADPAVVRRFHAALAAVCSTSDPARAVWHRANATTAPDEVVVDDLLTVARRAQGRGAPAAAARALEKAASLTHRVDLRTQLWVDAAEASWECGRGAHAQALLGRVRETLSDTAEIGRVEQLRGRIDVHSGSVIEGYEVLMRGALECAATSPDRSASMLVDAERAAAYDADIPRVRAAGQQASRLCRTERPPPAAAFVAGVAALYSGEPRVAIPLLEQAVSSSAEDRDPTVWVWRSKALAYLGDFDAARDAAATAASLARAQGALGTLATALEVMSFAELTFSPARAEADATEGLQLAEETGQSACAAMHLSTLAMIGAHRGDEPGVTARAERVFALARSRGHAFPALRARLALGFLDLSVGRPARGLDRLDELLQSTRHPAVVLLASRDLIEAAVRAGSPERGKHAQSLLEQWVSRPGSSMARAVALRSRALMEDGASVDRLFQESIGLFREYGESLDLARTQLLYGEQLRRTRRKMEARTHLRSAWDTFARLGAHPWAERAQAELRASGESVRPHRSGHTAELTPQELQIARLVVEGGSSKDVAAQLFLSPRTVDYHLRKVFVKTGISSRAQLRSLDLGS